MEAILLHAVQNNATSRVLAAQDQSALRDRLITRKNQQRPPVRLLPRPRLCLERQDRPLSPKPGTRPRRPNQRYPH